MSQQKVGKVFLSLAVSLSAIVSTIVDLLPGDTGHVHNPEWPAHAVFHDIVMFLLLDWMAIVCLWLLWRKSAEPDVGVLVALYQCYSAQRASGSQPGATPQVSTVETHFALCPATIVFP